MNRIPLSKQEASTLEPGEALTIAAVMAVFTIVILTVVAYQLFSSKQAKVTLPDGYAFEWKSAFRP